MSSAAIIVVVVIFLLCITIGWFAGIKMFSKTKKKINNKNNGEKSDE